MCPVCSVFEHQRAQSAAYRHQQRRCDSKGQIKEVCRDFILCFFSHFFQFSFSRFKAKDIYEALCKSLFVRFNFRMPKRSEVEEMDL